jgi:hypothetical protein
MSTLKIVEATAAALADRHQALGQTLRKQFKTPALMMRAARQMDSLRLLEMLSLGRTLSQALINLASAQPTTRSLALTAKLTAWRMAQQEMKAALMRRAVAMTPALVRLPMP